MGAYEMVFVLVMAVVLWLIVYCLILVQRYSMDTKYSATVAPPVSKGRSHWDIEKAAFANLL
ncbi:hypothetical protein ANCCAN_01745 [Ancylostoma caninum]|uniref:Uncharacterized protein n=1 Tax=Ancylostoma caninum TaxID=29170 RepID=A0A368H8C4_ANCCA|nr:hypothetical protein ANCCAN_01745 [Ancylostoma caninum]